MIQLILNFLHEINFSVPKLENEKQAADYWTRNAGEIYRQIPTCSVYAHIQMLRKFQYINQNISFTR